MSKKEESKGFCVFYDWIEDLSYLAPEDAWFIIKAIGEYYETGISPVECVADHLKPVASIMFHQIKRQEAALQKRSEAGRLGGLAKAGKGVANDSKGVAKDSEVVANLPTETDTDTETNTETNTNTDTYIYSSSSEMREECDIDRSFEEFWENYPRKVGKGEARKAFRSIKPDGELLYDMVASLREWSGSEQWQRDGGKYIPYPATWLRREGWKDELCESYAPYAPSPPVPPSPSPSIDDCPYPGNWTAEEIADINDAIWNWTSRL